MGFGDVGGFLGAIVGDFATRGDREKERRAIEEERRIYENLPTDIRAELEALNELGPSAYGNIAQERAQRGSILDEFSRRGGGGGNSALLAALTAQQGNAQRAGMESLRSAGDASARQYRALTDAGAMAGGIRGQDYGVLSDRASALDRVAAYNAANRQQVAARNADRKNRAQEGNIDRRYQQANMIGGTYDPERDFYEREARRKRGLWAGGGQAVGAGVGYAVGAPGDPFSGAKAGGSGGWG